ncbi:MAG TPA: hypothetical protein VK887_04785 [Pseudonocardiaceae bacterium]|nr:hypothetical protein [Pseudonocardiaceae bacterium]
MCRLTRQRAPRAESAQFVTRHGKEIAVVLNIAEYRRMSGADVDLKDYLRSAPDLDALEIVRATRTRLPGRLGGSVVSFLLATNVLSGLRKRTPDAGVAPWFDSARLLRPHRRCVR